MKLIFKTSGAKQIDLVSNFYFGRVGADVSFPADRDLGSLHGQFIIEGKKAYIMDRGSTTGTFVNDVKIPPNKKVELKDGDWIRFGSQVASFCKNLKTRLCLSVKLSALLKWHQCLKLGLNFCQRQKAERASCKDSKSNATRQRQH